MIVTHGLTKRYGKTLAVDDLSFAVTPGVVTGFLGSERLGQVDDHAHDHGPRQPDAGPRPGQRQPLRRAAVAAARGRALLDAKAFHPGRSARNHLRILARTNEIPAAAIDEVLDIVGLTAVADQRAGSTRSAWASASGIAAALLGDPGVLLFDEPINGLDPEGIRWVRHLLRDLAAEGGPCSSRAI